MTRDELIEKLKGYEWRDIEFKEAQNDVPKSAYESVSAFANTEGGHLIFGVSQSSGSFEIIGVKQVDKVQSSFLNTLKSCQKIRTFVPVQECKIDDPKGVVLVFYVPEATRRLKPICLEGNLRESFVRRGGSDQHCTEDEVRRFIRDSSDKPYDTEVLENLNPEHCFDAEALRWYRKIFNEKNPSRHEALSDVEFLSEMGLVMESEEALSPTLASILLFGQAKYVKQVLARPVVDYQRIDFDFDKWTPEERWHDRATVEENLVKAWCVLVERFMKQADRPFSLDMTTLRRDDQPPDYIAFRESTINLLIHQDFGDQRRTPTVKIFKDRTAFWNPGDAFATTSQLLDATEKEIRNPSIVRAFRRIGLSDQAGTGMRTIFKNWRDLGHFPPRIDNNKADKAFGLVLLQKELISEQQQILLSTLGVRLSDPEAQTFAFACKEEQIDITDVRAVTGVSPADALAILRRLETQALLKALDPKDGIYILADQFRGKVDTIIPSKPVISGDLSTAQVGQKTTDLSTAQVQPLKELTETQSKIMSFCDVPRSFAEIMTHLDISHRGFFMRKHLQPLLDSNLMARTNPENPTAANQKYVLTKTGVDLNVRHQEDKKQR